MEGSGIDEKKKLKSKSSKRKLFNNNTHKHSVSSASGTGPGSSLHAGIEAERERRERLLRRLESQKDMPRRPTIVEAYKLQRPFAKALMEVLFVG